MAATVGPIKGPVVSLRPVTRYALTLLSLVIAADAAGPELLRDRVSIALTELWLRTPDRTMAVAPASVAVLLTAIQHNTFDPVVNKEIGGVLGTERGNPRLAARMLLAGLPELPPMDRSLPTFIYHPEGAWIRNRLRHRGEGTLSDRFVAKAADFGIVVESTGVNKPANIDQDRPAPRMQPENDLLFSSATHLRTSWAGNTFALSKPFRGTLTPASGNVRSVEMLTSEVKAYLHASTELFEAAILPGKLLVAVPNRGHTVNDLVSALQRNDVGPPGWECRSSDVHLPLQRGVTPMLEQLGVRTPFVDLERRSCISASIRPSSLAYTSPS